MLLSFIFWLGLIGIPTAFLWIVLKNKSTDEDEIVLSERDQEKVDKAVRIKQQTMEALQKKKRGKVLDERLPPGQRASKKWVVLDLGIRPSFDLHTDWKLTVVDGATKRKSFFSFKQLCALGVEEFHSDFHCYTGWSTVDMKWKGVSFKKILEKFQPSPQWNYLIQSGLDGYSTNAPRSSIEDENAFVAFEWNGNPIDLDHGVIRTIIPNLYGSKGAKFLTKIVFSVDDKPGFWESRGYHRRANVWLEERLEQDSASAQDVMTIIKNCDGKKLDLSGMKLTEIPEEVYSLTSLQMLYLNNNQLTEIPARLCQTLTSLNILGINQNQISKFPPEIAQLQDLMELYAHNNSIREITPELCSILNLTVLGLDNNKLQSIPPQVSQLEFLAAIFADNNEITSIPEELCKVTSLRAVMLSNNKLTYIPPSLHTLNLQWFGLNGCYSITNLSKELIDSGDTQEILDFLRIQVTASKS